MGKARVRRAAVALASASILAATAGLGASPAAARSTSPAEALPAKGPLSARLVALAAPAAQGRSRSAQARSVGLPARGPGSLLRKGDGRLLVDLRVADPAALFRIAALPRTSLIATAPGGLATIAVPTDQLAALGRTTGLRAAREIPSPRLAGTAKVARTVAAALPAPAETATACSSGKVHSQGDSAMGASTARSGYGVDGYGVKVGILSDSIGSNASAFFADVQAHELPGGYDTCGHTESVQILSDLDPDEGSDEGRAMAQIVHDLAPHAEIAFASAFKGELDFANQIRALRDAGATVIVDDVGYSEEPMFQDGPIAAAVSEVAADGVSYFSAAGNDDARNKAGRSIGSYEAPKFRSAGCPAAVAKVAKFSACHDFDPGSGAANFDAVTVPAGRVLDATIGWSEPMLGVSTDLDAFLLDSAGRIVDQSGIDNAAWGRPIEALFHQNDTGSTQTYRLVIARYSSAGNPRLKVIFHGSQIIGVGWTNTAGGDVVGPTLFGHPAATGAVAVGAKAWDESSMESFSTRGPAASCWGPFRGEQPAAATTPCASRGVQLVGSDGVATTLGRTTGLNPFYGTSAAAPHVAAVAALVKQLFPCLAPTQVRDRLKAAAEPVTGPPGSQGSGLVQAQQLFHASDAEADPCPVSAPPGAPTIDGVDSSQISLQWTEPPAGLTPRTISGYDLRWIDLSGNVVGSTELPPSNSTSVPTPPFGRYAFQVRARTTDSGTSAWSPRSRIVVPPWFEPIDLVVQMFEDFLGREPDDDELPAWLHALAIDYPPAKALAFTSDGALGPVFDPIVRQYHAYFLRTPDLSGLNYWVKQLRAGKSVSTISSSFAASAEFRSRYGTLTNKQFVELVYQNVLGRPGEASGVAYWTGKLDRKEQDRGQVMTGFSESAEHKNKLAATVLVFRDYWAMLRRLPTAGERATWEPTVVGHQEDLLQAIVGSQEYRHRLALA